MKNLYESWLEVYFDEDLQKWDEGFEEREWRYVEEYWEANNYFEDRPWVPMAIAMASSEDD